tara:strand:- start:4205 stop:4411 length:207 start_codon:yes stop_codon:yes gene_type:complete
MSINNEFADIVHNSLGDIDEKGDAIIFQEKDNGKLFYDQMPPLVFPFGYLIISSTFMYYDDEENYDED